MHLCACSCMGMPMYLMCCTTFISPVYQKAQSRKAWQMARTGRCLSVALAVQQTVLHAYSHAYAHATLCAATSHLAVLCTRPNRTPTTFCARMRCMWDLASFQMLLSSRLPAPVPHSISKHAFVPHNISKHGRANYPWHVAENLAEATLVCSTIRTHITMIMWNTASDSTSSRECDHPCTSNVQRANAHHVAAHLVHLFGLVAAL